jgi:hypothetical protein
MLPVMFPKWYGEHDQGSQEAATSLVWLSHGYMNCYRYDQTLFLDYFSDHDNAREVTTSMLEILVLEVSIFRAGPNQISVISGRKNPTHDHPTGRIGP